jgi:hypothetical protein
VGYSNEEVFSKEWRSQMYQLIIGVGGSCASPKTRQPEVSRNLQRDQQEASGLGYEVRGLSVMLVKRFVDTVSQVRSVVFVEEALELVF